MKIDKLFGVGMSAIASLVLLAMLAGCASAPKTEAEAKASAINSQKNLAVLGAAMDALEDANFEGEVVLETGGSPLGFHARQSFWAGPAESVFRVNGRVDFTKVPRPSEPSTDD